MKNEQKSEENALVERNILSILLFDNKNIPDAIELLTENHFEFSQHKTIFNLICELYKTSKFVDPISLKEQILQRKINIPDNYVVEIVNDMPAFNNLKNYVNFLDNKLKVNTFLDTIEETLTNSEHITFKDLPTQIDNLVTKLNFCQSSIQNNSSIKSFKEIQEKVLLNLENSLINPENNKSINTRYEELDSLIGGIFPGDLIIIAGRPAMGKTAFACNIAFNHAKHILDKNGNGNILIFSLEMTSEQILSRFLNINGMLHNSIMRSTKINSTTYDYIDKELEKISTLPIFIDDNGNHNINSIKANAKSFSNTHKIDLVIVDYLQLINGIKTNSSSNRVQELSEISRGLKSLSKELGCPIIALSQLSRTVESRENKRPFMSDLRDSGSIEQDADMVLLLFREEYYHQNVMPDVNDGKKYSDWSMKMDRIKGKTEIIVAKNRFGKTGVSNLEFEPTFTRFKSF